jgi:hypothetical protein
LQHLNRAVLLSAADLPMWIFSKGDHTQPGRTE